MLTVKEVSNKTGIPISTVNLYCRQKKFPNAAKTESPIGAYWLVPETDLPLVKTRKPGRPKSGK